MSKRCLFLTAALIFLSTNVWGQLLNSPWPKFHKDIRNSGFGGFGDSGSIGTTKGRLKWKFETDGFNPVTTSPVLDNNGHLYFGANDKSFYCVDRSTGRLVWKYKTGGAIQFCTAAIDKDAIIYFGTSEGYLYAFNTNTVSTTNPQPLWTADVGASSNAGITSSPTIIADPDAPGSSLVIVASNNGRVYAVRPNGTKKWTSPDPSVPHPRLGIIQPYGALWASPLITDGGETVVVASMDFDPSPRTELFYTESPFRAFPYTLCPYLNEVIGITYSPNVFAIDTSTGLEKWYYPSGCAPGGMYGSPVAQPDGDIILNYNYYKIDGCADPPQGYASRVINFEVEFSGRTTDFPTDNDCISFLLPPLAYDADILIKVPKLFWATPTIFSDNTIFTAAGESLYRKLPGGNSYNNFFTSVDRIESSPVVDAALNVFFGCDGGKFYSLCASCSNPDTLLNWTYPPGDERIKKSDNVTFAEFKSTPSIDNDAKHSVYVGANNGNVYAFWDGASISGTILNEDTTPLAGVKITIKNILTNLETVTYTSPTGEYTTTGLDNGQYLVTPEKQNTVFAPPIRTVVINGVDASGVDFTAALGFIVTGRVVDAIDGTGMENVTVTIQGKSTGYSASVATSDNGTYSFPGIGYDTFTITPALTGWGFDPPSFTQAIPAGTSGGQTYTLANFEGTLGYQISGKVIDPTILDNTTENGIENVTITLTGDSTFTTVQKSTNPQGMYSFTGLPNGTYTVTPSLGLYKFSPKSLPIEIQDANVLNKNFYGATGLTISGTIKMSGTETSFDGFTVNLYRDDETFWSKIFNRNKPRTLVATATVASASGFFIFMGVDAGKYIVEPSAAGYGFSPASTKVTALTDVANLVFTASEGFTISGKVTNIIGIGQSDFAVNLINIETDAAAVTATNSDGSYTFTGLEAGTYTVLPEPSSFYIVTPASKSVTITLESQRKVNFIVISFCSKPIITLPFWGSDGDTVYIIGTNFGPPPTDNTTSVAITLSDGTTASLPAGVYFGTNDPATWVSAKFNDWTPVYITAKVPVLDGRIMRVWVVKPALTTCITIAPTNFFINTRM